ncbi:MAG: 2-amino-4-hydroxy-6-hydroxymethyldihydropteridine diphosphokinase, partial [Thiotrichales bacterium]
MSEEIILGLGSNLGNQLQNLENALTKLKQIKKLSILKVSSLYKSDPQLPDNAPLDWNRTYINTAIKCTTTLTPEKLLIAIKQTEIDIGRTPADTWAPRVIDIDILLFGKKSYSK